MTTRISYAVAALSLGILATACSSGSSNSSNPGGGPAGPVVTSVPEEKIASELSEADATQYCNELRAYSLATISLEEQKKLACTAVAALGAMSAKSPDEAQSQCQLLLSACMSGQFTQKDAGASPDPCASAKANLAGCTATVAEINQCTQDNAAAAKNLASTISCETLLMKVDGGTPGTATPASCQTIQQKCPSMASSGKTGK